MRTTTARGGAAGAVGVVAMDAATWLLYRRESKLDLLREKQLRPYDKDTAARPRAAGRQERRQRCRQLRAERRRHRCALRVRDGDRCGVPGAAPPAPAMRTGRGSPYGFGLYVANDLLAARLLRIAGPLARPTCSGPGHALRART